MKKCQKTADRRGWFFDSNCRCSDMVSRQINRPSFVYNTVSRVRREAVTVTFWPKISNFVIIGHDDGDGVHTYYCGTQFNSKKLVMHYDTTSQCDERTEGTHCYQQSFAWWCARKKNKNGAKKSVWNTTIITVLSWYFWRGWNCWSSLSRLPSTVSVVFIVLSQFRATFVRWLIQRKRRKIPQTEEAKLPKITLLLSSTDELNAPL